MDTVSAAHLNRLHGVADSAITVLVTEYSIPVAVPKIIENAITAILVVGSNIAKNAATANNKGDTLEILIL